MASLYNRYRPTGWDSVIGQDDVITPIKRQIINGKPSHAYLLVGTRGTGKTTTAKIISKAVNCLDLKDGSPCGVCANCKSNSLDIMELDAASNNGVDNIRGIIESSAYPPANLKYKVYIIDEVHMLSKGAFNALLKTLEEPPKYCIFILATTEVNKVPATIRSRCQRYEFNRITIDAMVERMSFILTEERVAFEKEALALIGTNADGALRDALSMLDQACFVSDGKITYNSVAKMIGCTDKTVLIDFTKAIILEKIKDVIFTLQSLIKAGKDMYVLISDVLQILRDIMVLQVAPDYILDNTKEYSASIEECALSFSPKRITFLVSRLNKVLNKVAMSTNPVITVENELMLIFHGVNEELEETLIKLMSRIEALEEVGVPVSPPYTRQRVEDALGVSTSRTPCSNTVDCSNEDNSGEMQSLIVESQEKSYSPDIEFAKKNSNKEDYMSSDIIQKQISELCMNDSILNSLLDGSKLEFTADVTEISMNMPLVSVFEILYLKKFEELGIKITVKGV